MDFDLVRALRAVYKENEEVIRESDSLYSGSAISEYWFLISASESSSGKRALCSEQNKFSGHWVDAMLFINENFFRRRYFDYYLTHRQSRFWHLILNKAFSVYRLNVSED